MKLSAKIGIILAFVLLIVGLTMGFFVFNLTLSNSEQQVGHNYKHMSEDIIGEIDRTLYERYLDIQMISSDELIKNYILLEDRDTLDQKLLITRELQSNMILSGPWDLLSIYNAQSEFVISTDYDSDQTLELNESEKLALDVALNGIVYYSDVFLNNKGKATMIFSAPIYNDQKLGVPIIGATLGYFSWPTITDVLQRVEFHHYAYLYNQEGKLIASSLEGKNDLILQDKSYQSIVLKNSIKSDDEFLIVDSIFDDFESLSVYSPQAGYLNYKGHDWILVLETSTADAFSDVLKSTIKTIILFSSVFLFISIVVMFLVWRLLVYPIKELYQTMHEITKGDVEKRADGSSKDEVGQLARLFNKLMDDLANVRAGVEKKVIERTSQLEKLNKSMIGRELKMIELKKKISDLENKNIKE